MRGEIGDVLSVDFQWMIKTSHGADYCRRWHAHKANSGGLMLHKASHHFDVVNWWLCALPVSVHATGKREFYTPTMARSFGLIAPGERCLTCIEKSRCGFYLNLAAIPGLKPLYLDHENQDGYIRERCVFRPDIDIEDRRTSSSPATAVRPSPTPPTPTTLGRATRSPSTAPSAASSTPSSNPPTSMAPLPSKAASRPSS